MIVYLPRLGVGIYGKPPRPVTSAPRDCWTSYGEMALYKSAMEATQHQIALIVLDRKQRAAALSLGCHSARNSDAVKHYR